MTTAPPLKSQFTSDASKFFLHQESMASLRNGKGMPIVSHIMLTDICQHSCAMCSVQTREGHSLTMAQVKEYLDQIVPLGLKAVILSGGGNPILFRCKETGADFNDAVTLIRSYGLEIGLITNGMPMKDYTFDGIAWDSEEMCEVRTTYHRNSWKTVKPETLDKLTWCRISMSGLDHKEKEVFVPDFNPTKTTLGFSYIYHDIYVEPKDENHGKVSTPEENVTKGTQIILGKDRLPWLTQKFKEYVGKHEPVYLRLLPNCLQPAMIPQRCAELEEVAKAVNPEIAFVQMKPPKAPKRCFLGYVHPVLNSDGFVFPCDSVCLANAALKGEHKFGSPWAICKWNEIADYFSRPVKSMVDSQRLCGGCVFHSSNDVLASVVDGGYSPMPEMEFSHPNFV